MVWPSKMPRWRWALALAALVALVIDVPIGLRIGLERYSVWSVLDIPIERTSLEAKQDARDSLRCGIVANNILTLHQHGGEETGWHGWIIVGFATLGRMALLLIAELVGCLAIALVFRRMATANASNQAAK